MKAHLIAVLLGASLSTAQAEITIELESRSVRASGKNDVGETTYTIAGKCGAAHVRFENVTRDESLGFRADYSSKLVITTPKGKVESGAALELDGNNELACVVTPKGAAVVLAAWCGATSCPPVQYQVVEATTGAVRTKADWDNPCDRKCAERALGTTLPVGLESF